MYPLKLIRLAEHPDTTSGVLFWREVKQCWATLEPAWKKNQANESCIPTGIYKIRTHESAHHGACLAVLDVPDREDIQIHIGNTRADTHGCILVGNCFANGYSEGILHESRAGMERLLECFKLLKLTETELEIVNDASIKRS